MPWHSCVLIVKSLSEVFGSSPQVKFQIDPLQCLQKTKPPVVPEAIVASEAETSTGTLAGGVSRYLRGASGFRRPSLFGVLVINGG